MTVFVSHSSADKPAVTRLVGELINRGIPVWYDILNIEAGDSLSSKISVGIADSDYFLIVLSPNSVRSDWVKHELKVALQKQQEIGRKLLVPVLLENVDLRASFNRSLGKFLDDLVYFNFDSGSRLEAASKLAAFLRSKGLKDTDISPHNSLVPVMFTRGVHLNVYDLRKRVEALSQRMRSSSRSKAKSVVNFKPHQFMVEVEPDYALLKKDAYRRIEDASDESDYSPQREEIRREAVDLIESLEQRLVDGLALIATHCDDYYLGDTAYWFAKYVRARILWLFASSGTRLELAIMSELDQHPPPHTDSAMSQFYRTTHFTKIAIIRNGVPAEARKRKDVFTAWITTDCQLALELREGRGAVAIPAVRLYSSIELMTKYVFPQMIQTHLTEQTAMIWKYKDFAGFHVKLD